MENSGFLEKWLFLTCLFSLCYGLAPCTSFVFNVVFIRNSNRLA